MTFQDSNKKEKTRGTVGDYLLQYTKTTNDYP